MRWAELEAEMADYADYVERKNEAMRSQQRQGAGQG